MDELIVRRALTADVEAISACVTRAYFKYVSLMGREPGPMTENYAEVIRQHEAHVATDCSGRLLGLLVLVQRSDYLLLDNVAVDPAAQGRGVGGRLLRLAEQRAKALGYDRIELYTHVCMTDNQALYPALGYEESRRVTEQGYDRIYYRKAIDPGNH